MIKAISGMGKAMKAMGTHIYPHIMVPPSKVITMPIQAPTQAREKFTIPYDLARLYVEVLKYKRKIVKVEKGVVFYTIHLSPPKKLSNGQMSPAMRRHLSFKPIILGNIFD